MIGLCFYQTPPLYIGVDYETVMTEIMKRNKTWIQFKVCTTSSETYCMVSDPKWNLGLSHSVQKVNKNIESSLGQSSVSDASL